MNHLFGKLQKIIFQQVAQCPVRITGLFLIIAFAWAYILPKAVAALLSNPSDFGTLQKTSMVIFLIVTAGLIYTFLKILSQRQHDTTDQTDFPDGNDPNENLANSDSTQSSELRETHDFLENLINYANAPIIVWDPQNTITRFNRAFERLTELNADEVIGHHLDMLFPESSRNDSLEEIARTASGEFWETVEIPILTKSGKTRFVLWNSANIYADNKIDLQATIAQGVDITERRNIFRELSETRDFLEKLFGHANAPIIVWNTGNKIMRFNKAFERMTGFSATEVIGEDLAMLFPESSRPDSLQEIARTSVGEFWETVEVPILCKNGETRLVLWNSANIYSDNGVNLQATIAQGVDISDRVRAEVEREELQEQVLHKQKLESLGILAGGVAHDFNNILTSILGNAGLIEDEISKHSPVLPLVKEIEAASRRASDLCNQMLAYSGKGQFIISPVDLNDLIKDMIKMLEIAISKNSHIELHFTTPIPAILVDPTQTRQIIMNLITNASEAFEENNGTIQVFTRVLHLSQSYLDKTYPGESLEKGTFVSLEVIDDGSGMDENTLNRIFDPFFTTKFTGRGLGLAAIQGIVRGHQGTINVTSTPGEGSCFTVLFPASDIQVQKKTIPDKKVSHKLPANGTVLLVDDEEYILKVSGLMLERLGFTVLTASDGKEALEVYQKSQKQICCILMDLTMPVMGGEQALQMIRKLDSTVPVIISSGYSESEILSRFSEQSLVFFIQKPYQATNLAEVLEQAFQNLSIGNLPK